MDGKGCATAFVIVGVLAIVIGIPASYVIGVFMAKIVIPALFLLLLAGVAIAFVLWATDDDQSTS